MTVKESFAKALNYMRAAYFYSETPKRTACVPLACQSPIESAPHKNVSVCIAKKKVWIATDLKVLAMTYFMHTACVHCPTESAPHHFVLLPKPNRKRTACVPLASKAQ